jgi:hypothetical protein
MTENLDFSKIRNSHIKPLDLETILKAIHGDNDCMIKIIEHYKPYLKELATTTIQDELGNETYYLNETMRMQLENRLIKSVLKFKVRPQ